MWGGDIVATTLGLTGLCLGALAFILWVGVSFGLIVSQRMQRASEDEADEFTNTGRSPASQGRAGALRAEPRAGSQAIPNARGE